MSLDGKGKAVIAMRLLRLKRTNHDFQDRSYIDLGAAVTTSRNDVDYIVTEYGIAN
jgi:4-hydroxybutyrate CoA-transferase